MFRRDFSGQKKPELVGQVEDYLAEGAQPRGSHERVGALGGSHGGGLERGLGEQALTAAGLGRPAKVSEHPLKGHGTS